MPVSIALADDSLIVREGVGRILHEQPDLEVVASCGDLPSLLEAIDRKTPDVVVTDIRMPPSDADEGVRVAAVLRDSHPEVGVVLLSQYADPGYALALFREGSARRGYLLKNRLSDPRMLLAAIANVDRKSVV